MGGRSTRALAADVERRQRFQAVGGKMSAYVIKLGTGVLDNAGNIESEEYAELTASGSLRNTGTIALEKSLLLTGTAL